MLVGCFSSGPDTECDDLELLNIAESSSMYPELRIMAIDLYDKSRRLKPLYGENAEDSKILISKRRAIDIEGSRMAIELTRRHQVPKNSAALTSDIEKCPVELKKPNFYENILSSCLISRNNYPNNEDYHAISSIEIDGKIGRKILQDLLESWNTHFSQKRCSVTSIAQGLVSRLQGLVEKDMENIHEYLVNNIDHQFIEAYPLHSLSSIATNAHHFTIDFFLKRVLDKSLFLQIFPFSDLSVTRLMEALLLYLELLVFSNKLHRITILFENENQNAEKIKKEIENCRHWNSSEHVRWLVMEVEGALQIRHAQYVLAKHLIDNEGSISQLNMGQGKTRIVLPMLALYYTEKERRNSGLVRITVLSSLLDECYDFFQRYLMASNLNVLVYQLPFNRSLTLTPKHLRITISTFKECQSIGGIVLMSPEWHSSLLLKSKEATKNSCHLDPWYKELLNLLGGICILDESDALLHPRYQLVYSVGVPSPLEHGSIRWNACQIVLHLLNTMDVEPSLASKRELNEGEYWPLLLKRDRTKPELNRLLRKIATSLVNNPPREFEWLGVVPKNGRNTVIDFLCNSLKPSGDFFKLEDWKDCTHYYQLLALRGLLSFGLLETVLLKNHREE